MTSLLIQPNINEQFLARFIELFKVIISLLRYVEKMDLFSLKRKPSNYNESLEFDDDKNLTKLDLVLKDFLNDVDESINSVNMQNVEQLIKEQTSYSYVVGRVSLILSCFTEFSTRLRRIILSRI